MGTGMGMRNWGGSGMGWGSGGCPGVGITQGIAARRPWSVMWITIEVGGRIPQWCTSLGSFGWGLKFTIGGGQDWAAPKVQVRMWVGKSTCS